MGWLWSSSVTPSSSKGSNATNKSEATTVDQSSTQSRSQQAPAKETQTTAAATTTNDYGDPEIAKFMAQIQQEFGTKPADEPAKGQDAGPAQNTSSFWSSWGSSSQQQQSTSTNNNSRTAQTDPYTPPARLDPLSESLLPTTMSCRQAFDMAFHCNSLGGQWTSVYRSGSVRSCSEHWSDFWFCMRTRAYPAGQREAAIRDHYRRREWTRYRAPGQPSSTDVWEPRLVRVTEDDAEGRFEPFRAPYEGLAGVSDEEWYVMEIERRRRVQEALRAQEATRDAQPT